MAYANTDLVTRRKTTRKTRSEVSRKLKRLVSRGTVQPTAQ